MFASAHAYTRPLRKIEIPSTFPVNNRRVFSLRSGNMSAKTQATDASKVMRAVVDIASYKCNDHHFDHRNQKGVIHTYNKKITAMVMQALKDAGMGDRSIALQGSGKAREEVLNIFKKSTRPMILVSPSAMLGLSLNDDLGRWQCIVKTPYPFLGDKSVVHRKDTIDGWYEWQTAKDLIQMFGRIVRSQDDWGMTYILDEAFAGFYERNVRLFPGYIRSAIWQKQS